MILFLHGEAFACPFPAVPTASEDDAAGVFVKGEGAPDAEKSEAEDEAKDVSHANGNEPLEDDADDYGIDGVARGTKTAAGEYVAGATDLKCYVDNENPCAKG